MKNESILEEGEIEATEIATAGIIVDDFGNKWTLPVSELGEDYSADYDPMSFPKRDERFHYQFEKTDRLGWATADGFVPVRRSEIGLVKLNDANNKLKDYGVNVTSDENPIHAVGDLTLVKIPMAIRKIRLARAKAEADRAIATIEPPKTIKNVKAGLKDKLAADGIRFEESAQRSEQQVVARTK